MIIYLLANPEVSLATVGHNTTQDWCALEGNEHPSEEYTKESLVNLKLNRHANAFAVKGARTLVKRALTSSYGLPIKIGLGLYAYGIRTMADILADKPSTNFVQNLATIILHKKCDSLSKKYLQPAGHATRLLVDLVDSPSTIVEGVLGLEEEPSALSIGVNLVKDIYTAGLTKTTHHYGAAVGRAALFAPQAVMDGWTNFYKNFRRG